MAAFFNGTWQIMTPYTNNTHHPSANWWKICNSWAELLYQIWCKFKHGASRI